MLQSVIFLKKMTPCTIPTRAQELWSRSKGNAAYATRAANRVISDRHSFETPSEMKGLWADNTTLAGGDGANSRPIED
jgi:hypothetical protein